MSDKTECQDEQSLKTAILLYFCSHIPFNCGKQLYQKTGASESKHCEMCIRDRVKSILNKSKYVITNDEKKYLKMIDPKAPRLKAVSYTHLDVYKRQISLWEY